jgi:D-alanyl-D-alanine carboxypeptidase
MLPAAVTSRIAQADRITLRMLLNHTSGIAEWDTPDVDVRVVSDPGHVYTTDEIIDLAARQPSSFEPGTSWSYSNTNYTLVGLVLDGAGGQSWRALVRERVLKRLVLSHTFLPEPGDRTMADPYAHGYQDVSGTMVDLSAVDPSMAGAGGGHAMVTTIQDLARFLEALLGGELYARPDTLVAMTTMVEAPNESGLPHRYGLGLESYDLPGGATIVGNSGGTAGYATMMYRIPASDTTLVTSVNTSDMFANALEVYIPAVQAITAPAR